MAADTRFPPSAAPLAATDAALLIERAGATYERGLYVTALHEAAPLGPLEQWPGPAGLVLAGRLANQLGNPRRGSLLHLRARRRHPTDGDAWLWAARVAWERFGTWRACRLLERGGPPGTALEEVLVLRGQLATSVRDFDLAKRLLGEAEALAPRDPWIVLQPAFLQAHADDHAAALAIAERSLELQPWFRPAVDLRAQVLLALGRDDEAVAWLEEAVRHLEASSTCELLVQLRLDREEFQAAEAALALLERFTPLRSRAYQGWLEGRSSDVAYHLGDRARAAAHARRSRLPFYEALAGRLDAATATGRVVLPVPHVRQHHRTCAPATLSAICALHRVPAGHLEIAEAICYDGTSEDAERQWAAAQGFVVREFRVTWDAAVALLDRGLPFTLSMVDPGNSHLVAVAGYDEARGVLLLRDPSSRSRIEIARGWLDESGSSGPRGMALAPPGAAHLLDGLDLPDAPLHDLYHQVQAALVAHDRPAAAAAAEALRAAAPGHRLAILAERSLAAYDGSEERRLAATDALLALFPDDVNLRLSRQASLASLGQRQARVDWLRAEQRRAPHPLLALALGEALHDDARDLAEALAMVHATVRRRPEDGLCLHVLGDVLWETSARAEALLAYRWAACLDRANEHFAEAYFRGSRFLKRTDEALDFLRGRVERQGAKSGRPVMTLVAALDALDLSAQIPQVLERALHLRPDDGEFLCAAARSLVGAGWPDRARSLLDRARGRAHQAEVLRTEALLAELDGDLRTAAEKRIAVSGLEPLDVRAAQAAARLLAETRDRGAAVAFFRERVARFPHHVGLGQALIGWLDEAPAEEREAELRRLLAAVPGNAWAWRELAQHLSSQGRQAEAFEALDRAGAVEPAAPALRNIRAVVLAAEGRRAEARATLRESLALQVDQDWTIQRLLELEDDAAGRAAALRFIRAELTRQVTFGDGLLAWWHHAADLIPPEEALATLREAHAARPDLWQAWVALGRQLVHLERLDEARAHLGAAAERFPLLPRVLLELGLVHRAAGDVAGWRQMLERALELNPAWTDAALKLAELLHGAGEFEPERALLERSLRHAPSDALLHGWLADALLMLGRPEEAVEELQRALRLDPGYAWALETLRREARRLGRPGLPEALAERLVEERALDPRAWLLAARTREALPARLEAIDRALALAPTSPAAVSARVDLLAAAGRYQEALAAVDAPMWRGLPPRSLRLQAARVEAQRGRPEEARRALDALLASEPDFIEGWEVATEWHNAAGRRKECLASARQLVRLSPQRPASLAWLGLALLESGERAPAKEALARAVALDPAYRWAVRRLFELRVEDREWAAARELLVLVERHFEPGDQAALRLRLAAWQGQWEVAAVELAGVARADDDKELDEAVRSLREAGGGEPLERALESFLDSAESPREAGTAWFAWARLAMTPRALERRLAKRLATGRQRPPALAGAVQPWLKALAEGGRRRPLRRWVRRLGPWLQSDVRLWGTTGYALTRADEPRRAVELLGAARPGAGVEPWMLFNLGYSLSQLGRLSEAAAVCREALALPADHVRWRLAAMVAFEAALRGDYAPVGELGDGDDPGRVLTCLAALAHALAAADTPAGGQAGWRSVDPHLVRAASSHPVLPAPRFLRTLWWRAAWRIARSLGRRGPASLWWLARVLARGLLG